MSVVYINAVLAVVVVVGGGAAGGGGGGAASAQSLINFWRLLHNKLVLGNERLSPIASPKNGMHISRLWKMNI